MKLSGKILVTVAMMVGAMGATGAPSTRAFSDRKCAHSSRSTFFCRGVRPSSASIAASRVPRAFSSRIPARTYKASAEIRSPLAICWSTSADG